MIERAKDIAAVLVTLAAGLWLPVAALLGSDLAQQALLAIGIIAAFVVIMVGGILGINRGFDILWPPKAKR